MTNKATKYGLMTIAAVLLVAMAFAGAASAETVEISADEWNSLTTSEQINGNETYKFIGAGIIYPKFNGSTSPSYYVPNRSITFDFTDYQGAFAGVPSTSANDQGALFGKIQTAGTSYSGTITIKNITLTSVTVSSTGARQGGILGNIYGDSNFEFKITNCTMVNCSIGSTEGDSCQVGGLIGRPWGAVVNIVDCKAMHCNVVASKDAVGGLVGYINGATVNFLRSNVTNSTISSNGGNVGGLAGGAAYVGFENCGVENTSVYAGGGSAGGLLGRTNEASTTPFMKGCMVKNCVIASGSDYVGGLFAHTFNAGNNGIVDCHVLNCTIAGSSYVGGMVGYTQYASGMSDNSVEYSAVNGTGSNVRLDCGDGKNLDCDADLSTNFINNGTYMDTITLYNVTTGDVKQPITSLNKDVVGTTFWKTIFNVTGVNSSSGSALKQNVFQVTYLSKYGGEGGYGAGSAPKYSITTGDVQNGTLTFPDSAVEGTSITVTATPDSGYCAVNWTYYTKTNDPVKIQVTQAFLMPAYGVTIGGDFEANVSMIVFYNESNIEIGSYINTYNSAKNFTDYVPTRSGYTPWWNVSESGVNLNSYVSNGNWVFTGNNDSILHAYVNWTENPPVYTPSSSSKQTGYTIILQEGQVAPNQVPTTTPTVAPTAKPTEKPATPVVNQTIIPTAKPTTQQSPAPFLGIIAGFGAAALFLGRMRR